MTVVAVKRGFDIVQSDKSIVTVEMTIQISTEDDDDSAAYLQILEAIPGNLTTPIETVLNALLSDDDPAISQTDLDLEAA